MTAIRALNEAIQKGGVPQRTLDLVHPRASQINGCSVCVGAAVKARKDGETDERLFTLAAWRGTPYFTDAERAALALAEAVTRLSDQADPVPDETWNEAARLYDERALAALVLWSSGSPCRTSSTASMSPPGRSRHVPRELAAPGGQSVPNACQRPWR